MACKRFRLKQKHHILRATLHPLNKSWQHKQILPLVLSAGLVGYAPCPMDNWSNGQLVQWPILIFVNATRDTPSFPIAIVPPYESLERDVANFLHPTAE
jgi:hypothetical protein